MHKYLCNLCKKMEWRLVLGIFCYDTEKHEEMINHDIFVCYSCATEFFASLMKVVDKAQSDCNIAKAKAKTVIPSLSVEKRLSMGKITKDELIDINLWINRLKSIKDFRRKNENEKENRGEN